MNLRPVLLDRGRRGGNQEIAGFVKSQASRARKRQMDVRGPRTWGDFEVIFEQSLRASVVDDVDAGVNGTELDFRKEWRGRAPLCRVVTREEVLNGGER